MVWGVDMWTAIISGISSIWSSWVTMKTVKNQAEANYQMALAKGEQDWDIAAQKAAQFSWKDEFITLVWFAPLVVAWFDQERAMKWVDFVTELPLWYQFGMFGIMAASFGLRWYFKQQQFKVGK